MLSELMDELVEDSPFLRQLRDESVAGGQMKEARATLRQLAQWRFPTLTETDLEAVDSITELDRLHALQQELLGMSDAEAFRRALHDAQA